jgi:hypothetical protein
MVVVVALVFSTMTLGVVAADTPMIVCSDVAGKVGETVDVTISLQDNPGMVSMTLTVTYDSDKLELTDVTDSDLLPGKTHKPELETPYTLAWANDTAKENITVEGVIVTLSFKILDTAVVGESYAVEIDYDLDNWDIYDCNSDVVEFGIKNGSVTIACPHTNTTIVNASGPDFETQTPGYTGDTKCLDCGEITGYGQEIPPVADKIILKSTSSYIMDETFVEKVKLSTTVDVLLTQFENDNLVVLDKNGNALTGSTLVGTGATINLYVDDVLVDSVTVVVLGDADGNGIVDTTDIVRVKAAFLGTFDLSEAENKAADVDKNGIIDTTDYVRVKSHFLGTFVVE